MTDTTIWNQLANEIRALQEENERLKATIAGTDCTLRGCIRQSCTDKKPLIYIAQPFGNKQENIILAQQYMLRLTEWYPQYVFISPVISFGFCYDVYSYTDGINQCLDLLAHADAIWIIGDDGNSRGVKIEREFAKQHGITAWEYADLHDAVNGREA